MEWLNYHHLLYFWTVVRRGSVSEAARELKLRQPTISAQIKLLEDSLGQRLFEKRGRQLVLTEHGSIAARYAEQIFSIGQELSAVLQERPVDKAVQLSIGIADVVPKLVAHSLIEPIYSLPEPHALVCREDSTEELLAELALHRLDLVISDAPIAPHINIKGYSHLLGQSPVAFFASRQVVAKASISPQELGKYPILLPTSDTALRRNLDLWFSSHNIAPKIAGEFEDSALMKIFGNAKHGLFPAPLAIAQDLQRQYRVRPVLTLKGVMEKFFAISLARQIKHPSVVALVSQANRLFKAH